MGHRQSRLTHVRQCAPDQFTRALGFAGFPMPADYPDYPSRQQQLAYLRQFARTRGLYDHIQFGSEVVSADRDEQGGWTLSLRGGRTVTVGVLVVANGHLWQPRVPGYPGTFTGATLHAVEYRSREQFAGRRVLVVGGGNSAADIACDAAAFAESVTISMRRGYHLVPKHIFGVPTDVFGHGGPRLPYRLKLKFFGGLVRLLVGDLRRYGLQRPDHPIMASHPIMNTQLVHHLQHGEVTARPDIEHLNGDTVRFVDGSSERFDIIVWATGYDKHPVPRTAASSVPRRRPRPFPAADAPRLPRPVRRRPVRDRCKRQSHAVTAGQTRGGRASRELRLPAGDEALRAVKRTEPELRGGVRHIDTERHSIYIQEEAYARAAHRTIKQLAGIARAAECPAPADTRALKQAN